MRRVATRWSLLLATLGVVALILAAPASVLAAAGGTPGPNESNQGHSSHGGSGPGHAPGSSSSSSSSSSSQSGGGSQSGGTGSGGNSGSSVPGGTSTSSSSGSGHSSPGDSNPEDVWVDGYSSSTAPVSSAGPGHEMDPHLGCPAYIILWGSGLADPTGIYTIDGWNPSGSGTGDYSHAGYHQDQAWPGTAANPSTASWNYSTAAGGTQEISYIPTATLVAHAIANGDAPVNGEGLHFKLQFVQDPQKHKTFWVNCPTPTPPPAGTPDLSITKKVSETTAHFGDTLTYTVVVTNSGTAAATNVVIDDTMSGTAGFTIKTTSFSPDAATVLSSSEVEWTIPTISANGGTSTETYSATISQPSPYDSATTYVLNNTASIVDCTGSGPCSATVTTDVPGSTPPPGAPDLSITKKVSETTAHFGDILTYTVVVTNSGSAAATNVVIDDTMSGTAGFTINTASFSPYAATVLSSSEVEWTIPTISANGGTSTETYTATISQPSPYDPATTYVLNNTASIVDCTGSGPCSATVTTDVPGSTPPPSNAPDLVVVKTVNATLAKVGQTVTYTITVSNIGGAAATNVVMTDVMSGSASFSVNLSSFSGVPPVTVTGAGTSADPFTWTYASIAAGAVDTVTYQATILGPGTTSVHGSRFEQLINTVTASGPGCSTTSCTSTVTTTAPLPPHGVLGATTTKKKTPTTPTPAGAVLGASVTTPGTGANLDLWLTIILVLSGLALIGLAVAARRRATPQA